MVVPVPCRFITLLKLLIRNSPSIRFPLLSGTRATPYGLTSPLDGTVELRMVMVLRGPMNEISAARAKTFAVATISASRPSTRTQTAREWSDSMLILLGGPCVHNSTDTVDLSRAGFVTELSEWCNFFE